MRKILFLITFIFLFKSDLIFAAGLNVDCNLSGCTKNTSSPLFSQAADGYWSPGRLLTKSILVTNHAAFPLIINLSASRSGSASILENVFNAKLSGISTIFNGNLTDFYQTSAFNLGILGSGSTATYSLAFAFDPNAGNSYQNKNTVFDLKLNFTENVSHPTPTPHPTPPPKPELHWWSLALLPLCSNSSNILNWQVHNFTGINIPFTWQVMGTGQKGTGIALADKNTPLPTHKTNFIQFVKISWGSGFSTFSLNPGFKCFK